MVIILSAIMLVLSPSNGPWLAMLAMLGLAFLFFFMRALYFAPFGEMGVPPRFSGSVIAVAAFVIYLPSAFAYLLWGLILDNYSGITGYKYLFGTLAVIATIGALIAHRLKQKLDSGSAEKIANSIALIDEDLSLEGQEKTLNKQMDEH